MSSNPYPRKGLYGIQDRILGPGTITSEVYMVWAVTLISPLVLLGVVWRSELSWTSIQLVLGAILVADLAGGVVANSTNASKAWWHRAGQGLKQHFLFTSLHLHPFIIAWLYLDGDWVYALVNYFALLAITLLLFNVSKRLHRPIAFLCITGILTFNIFLYEPLASVFMLLFFMKLVAGHLVYEQVDVDN